MSWLRRIAVVLVALLVVAAVGWMYLTAQQDFPETSSYRIDVAQLEAIAIGSADRLPVAVQHEQVAVAGMPRAAVFAGDGFEPLPFSHGAYRIVYADGSSLVVDAAFREEALAQMPGEGEFDAAAFARVLDAIREAEFVVFTHEHFDHIAGLAALEDFASVAPRLMLNTEQLENPQTADLLPAELLELVEPIEYTDPLRIAPGVVLVRAPGHTPGSQLVFVRPLEGKALLLIGDVAWHMDQIRNEHYRPRLVTDLMLGEDREAVLHQLRALKDLLGSDRVEVISSHDLDERTRLVAEGVLVDGFR